MEKTKQKTAYKYEYATFNLHFNFEGGTKVYPVKLQNIRNLDCDRKVRNFFEDKFSSEIFQDIFWFTGNLEKTFEEYLKKYPGIQLVFTMEETNDTEKILSNQDLIQLINNFHCFYIVDLKEYLAWDEINNTSVQKLIIKLRRIV